VLFCVLLVRKCVQPPGDNPIAVNKYIISFHIVAAGSYLGGTELWLNFCPLPWLRIGQNLTLSPVCGALEVFRISRYQSVVRPGHLYAFFWVISLCLNFICRRLGTLCFISMKMEQTECPEASAYKIQTPGNYPEENLQHSEHGES
jgi:hypothetical protein